MGQNYVLLFMKELKAYIIKNIVCIASLLKLSLLFCHSVVRTDSSARIIRPQSSQILRMANKVMNVNQPALDIDDDDEVCLFAT